MNFSCSWTFSAQIKNLNSPQCILLCRCWRIFVIWTVLTSHIKKSGNFNKKKRKYSCKLNNCSEILWNIDESWINILCVREQVGYCAIKYVYNNEVYITNGAGVITRWSYNKSIEHNCYYNCTNWNDNNKIISFSYQYIS